MEAASVLRLSQAVQKDGGLHDLGWYLCWTPDEHTATLDGTFTAEELMAIALYMKAVTKEQR